MKSTRSIILLLIVALVHPVWGQTDSLIDNRQFDDLESVRAFLSVDGSDIVRLGDIVGCSLTQLVDSTTPYLADQYDGRIVLRVVLDSLALRDTFHDSTRLYTRRLYMYFDTATGIPLQVFSDTNRLYPSALDLAPPRAKAEETLRQYSDLYTGLPEEPPAVGLARLIAELYYSAADPFEAETFELRYLMYDVVSDTAPPRAVWVADLWGGEDYMSYRNPGALYLHSHLRVIIDAGTGDWQMQTCAPGLLAPPDSLKAAWDSLEREYRPLPGGWIVD